MDFNKDKDEAKNLEILRKDIKKIKSQYSQILVDSLFSTSDPDEFRNIIKGKVSQYIDSKIKR